MRSSTTIKAVLLCMVGLPSCVGNEDITTSDCDVCRLVSRGFEKGFNKTQRLNFEGGNTAWESKNLGKYEESETRFIEILEMTCDKSNYNRKDKVIDNVLAKCLSFAEEREELLEEWFFRQRKAAPSLVAWLCVERLKVCCPENHFGPTCEPCPGDLKRPCFGNGACQGAGTRQGSGKCKCRAGYQGNLCRKCQHNYYLVSQNETHVACAECHEACHGGCSAAGPQGCRDCRPGWRQSENGCEDVDECASSPCSVNMFEVCENVPGSYRCVCREAFRREDGVCIPDPDARRPVFLGLRARDVLRCAAYGGLIIACVLIWLRPTVILVLLFVSTCIVMFLIEKGYIDDYIEALISAQSNNIIMNDSKYSQERRNATDQQEEQDDHEL